MPRRARAPGRPTTSRSSWSTTGHDRPMPCARWSTASSAAGDRRSGAGPGRGAQPRGEVGSTASSCASPTTTAGPVTRLARGTRATLRRRGARSWPGRRVRGAGTSFVRASQIVTNHLVDASRGRDDASDSRRRATRVPPRRPPLAAVRRALPHCRRRGPRVVRPRSSELGTGSSSTPRRGSLHDAGALRARVLAPARALRRRRVPLPRQRRAGSGSRRRAARFYVRLSVARSPMASTTGALVVMAQVATVVGLAGEADRAARRALKQRLRRHTPSRSTPASAAAVAATSSSRGGRDGVRQLGGTRHDERPRVALGVVARADRSRPRGAAPCRTRRSAAR